MKNLLAAATVAAGATLCAATGAQALIISADFYESADYEAGGARQFARVNQALPGSGFELVNGDQTANPSNWGGMLLVDLDPATNILTLRGDAAGWYYSEIIIEVADIAFSGLERIVGLSPVSTGAATFVEGYPFTITTSFTDDSLFIRYAVTDPSTGSFGINTADDTFQIVLGADSPAAQVPLPAALPLLGAGLAGLGLFARRRA